MEPTNPQAITLSTPNCAAVCLRAIINLATADSARAYKVCGWIAAAALAVTAIICVQTGPIVQILFGHDTVGLLDGAWKVYGGYRPHIDFYNFVGDFEFILFAAVMKLIGPTASALPVGNAFFAIGAGIAAWIAARRRLSAPLLLLFVLFIGFIVFSTHLLRHPFVDTTYATLYNRHAFALATLVAVPVFLPPFHDSRRRNLLEAFVIGAIVALLFFIKISFFLAAGFLIVCGLLVHRSTRQWLPGMLLGAVCCALPFLIYLHFDLRAIFDDLSIAAAARMGVISLRQTVRYVCLNNNHIALLVLMWMLTLFFASPGNVVRKLSLPLFVGAAILGCSVFVVSTSAAFGTITEVPLLLSAAFILTEFSRRQLRQGNREPAGDTPAAPVLKHFVVCCLCLLLVGEILLRDAASVAYAAYSVTKRNPPSEQSNRFQSSSMSKLFFAGLAGDAPTYETTYAEKTNDGLQLLERSVPATSRVATFDFTNPFPFASLRPPQGGPVFWHHGYEFNRAAHPSAEAYLGDANAVMIPRFSGDPETTDALLDIYATYLAEHFEPQAESHYWILHRRKAGSPANRNKS